MIFLPVWSFDILPKKKKHAKTQENKGFFVLFFQKEKFSLIYLTF